MVNREGDPNLGYLTRKETEFADMEMKNKFINHARNVWDRAITLLPMVHQLWYKYIHMEEMLGNVAGARQIFERWMSWEPDQQAWLSYIKFELRYNEIERALGRLKHGLTEL
nr:crooked neck-like protein 1 [Tanacetum cinerariifolium]